MPRTVPALVLALMAVLACLLAPPEAPAENCMESDLWPPMTDTMSLHPAPAPKKAIDLSWPAPDAPTALALWSYHGGANQRWKIYMGVSAKLPNSYMIKTTADRRCLVWSRPAQVLPERLHTVPCNAEDPAQRWCVTGAEGGAVRIRNYKNGGCLTAEGDWKQEGIAITIKPCANLPGQRWLVR